MKNMSILLLSAMTAAGPALAAESSAAAGPMLEEVVITAQKRTERLQDVTVSAAVLSGDTVNKLNAGDISDLNRMVPSDSRAGNALDDVQSVEVLKGPQATLGGRTAAQGVINVVTHRPSDTLTGTLTLMGTNDREYRGNGFISGPISNSFKYSFDGYYSTRQFPIKNLKLDNYTGQPARDAQRYFGLRLSSSL
jgi:iron complex outermembrane recepter protein